MNASTSVLAFLKDVAIFSDLNDRQRELVIPLLQPVRLTAGERLFSEGDPGETLYVLQSGECAITVKLPDGQEFDIASFAKGDFFGEMSIFEDAPRSATCYARVDSMLFALAERDFKTLFSRHPKLAMKVMFRMLTATAGRLRDTNVFLSDMVQWGDAARKRAITDEATGLFNRRFLDEAIVEQFQKAGAGNRPLSVVMLDLDHFNSINDEFGMAVGDEVILSVIPVFRGCFRESDIVSRYGGDEFTILMPDTPAAEAHAICSEICRKVAALDVLANRGGTITRVTTSQGIAAFPQHGTSVETVRERADQALYRAKELGRNRAEVADQP